MDFLGCQLRQLLQTFLQLQREFLIALLAHRLHVKLHKFIPLTQRTVIKMLFANYMLH